MYKTKLTKIGLLAMTLGAAMMMKPNSSGAFMSSSDCAYNDGSADASLCEATANNAAGTSTWAGIPVAAIQVVAASVNTVNNLMNNLYSNTYNQVVASGGTAATAVETAAQTVYTRSGGVLYTIVDGIIRGGASVVTTVTNTTACLSNGRTVLGTPCRQLTQQ